MNPDSPALETPRAIYRADYRPTSHRITHVELEFDLKEEETLVRARLKVERNREPGAPDGPLELHGEDLDTLWVRVDGELWDQERLTLEAERLVISGAPDSFTLETEVRLHPEKNLQLSGLYKTTGTFCTQCEAEGFRRITWFLDRPDVMAVYRTTITAEKKRYPVMLSNGNRTSHEDLEDGRHRVVWDDPFPKPSYLFALVAGDLHRHSGNFTTKSGRDVALEIYVEHREANKCEHALTSLQKSMEWDERVFGLEYDLDIYMIVAVSDFNMGAMENKGLNVFNSKFVLAHPETATDADFEGVEAVIAHEYFHNWTGNRVTCRDWFQLTLKEGLTVYRDQRFSSDMHSAPVQRIENVQMLRSRQFPEDSGPMAHPVRPDSYISMDNFYTATVYEKGSEVVRMYATLLGEAGFRKGMDLYFERHDGQAVTCDEFRSAMADANGRNLDQFERWYRTKGTPRLEAKVDHDATAKTFTLKLRQDPGVTCAEKDFEPLLMPVEVGLIGPNGADLPLQLEGEAKPTGTSRVLELTEREQVFVFVNVAERPIPSILRNFSAPVELRQERSPEDLAFALAHDSDAFNRWEAGQVLLGEELLAMAACHQRGEPVELSKRSVEALRRVLLDDGIDGALKANMLALPSSLLLAQRMDVIDPDALSAARKSARQTIADALAADLRRIYTELEPTGGYTLEAQSIRSRRLRNTCLGYLVETGEGGVKLAARQFAASDNMTDSQSSLACLVGTESEAREQALAEFYARWKEDPLVLDKWFTLQAISPRPDVAERVVELTGHPDFNQDNPNRLRSLVGAFAGSNLAGFHRKDGIGYRLLGDQVLALQAKNPQIAARLVSNFNQWRRFDEGRQAVQKEQLERIAREPGLSKDVFEIVSRALTVQG